MAKTAIVVGLEHDKFVAVELQRGGQGAEICRFTVKTLPEEGLTPEWLSQIWKNGHFSHGQVILVIPRALTEYQILNYPDLPEEQIRAAVRLELEGNGSAAELKRIIGITKQDDGYVVRVGSVAVAKLNEILSALRQAGLEPQWSGLQIRGLHSFLNMHLNFFQGNAYNIWLDIGAESAELAVIDGENIIYRRTIGKIGIDELRQEPEQARDELCEEIRLSLAAFKAIASSGLPERIWLFGDLGDCGDLPEKLEREFGIKFYLPDKSRLAGVLTGGNTALVAALLGVALDAVDPEAKEDYRYYTKEQERQKVNRKNFILALRIGAAAVAVIAGLIFQLQAKAVQDVKDAAWLREQAGVVSRLRRLEKDTRRKSEHLTTLGEWFAERGRELIFLKTLEEVIPEGTYIEDLTIEDGVVKNIAGTTPSVSRLLIEMRQAPNLRGFKIKGPINVNKDGMEGFQLEGRIILKELSL